MPLPSRDEALELARGAIERSPAVETEVTVDAETDRFARFAAEGPTQSADRERLEVKVRVRVEKEGGLAEARVVTNATEPDGVDAAVRQAVELAGHAPGREGLVPLGGPVELEETAPERPTLDHTFREKARWIERAVEACRGEDFAPSGLARTTGFARAIATSAGRAVFGATSRASFSLTATGPDGAGFAERISRNVDRIDADEVVARAVRKAADGRDPARFGPGETTVVLEPSAVSSLLLFASYRGFGAKEVEEESSFLCGRIGQRAFAESVSIHDDAGHALHTGFAFDGEGTPRSRVALVQAGVLREPVTDREFAARLGRENTGHARPQPTTAGPGAENLVVAPGGASVEDLVRGVERGLLVTQLHYVNLIDPREMALTGMTRNGTFEIVDGEVGRAVRDLRFTDSLVRMLASVTGIGHRQELAGALFDGDVVTPAVRIEGFRFTSTTE